ncbi:MAG: tyrosine-type recombinase/integrase, partial [Terriglobales bacterium]
CNPVYAANRRLKPLHAVVNGNPEHHPEGVYNLRYLDGKRRVWEPVGNDPNAALAAKLRREHIVRAKDMGILVVDERKKDDARVTLADAIEKFLVRVRLHRSHKTQKEFVYMLSQFAQVCAKTYLDQVIGDDLLHFAFRLRELGLADRTVANRVARIECFLRANGITGLLASNERPRFDKKVVEAYNEDELKRLFKAANNEERLLFQFFLGSGCREAEVAHATWRDVNFADKTFTVHSKRKQGFGPKDKEERMIPLPDSLVEALKPRRRLYADSHYIFPNKDGRPHGHFLRILKRLVLRAGLNCGECTNRNGLSCRKHPVCDRWELHKFRRTFATMHHEAGVSARTLQAWLGHSDLETTLAYLQIADVRSDRTREQVNNSFAAFRAATG